MRQYTSLCEHAHTHKANSVYSCSGFLENDVYMHCFLLVGFGFGVESGIVSEVL